MGEKPATSKENYFSLIFPTKMHNKMYMHSKNVKIELCNSLEHGGL